MKSKASDGAVLLRGLLLVLMLCLSACAGHAQRTQDARTALDEGRGEDALALYNELLEVETAEDIPSNLGGDNSLLLLDRAMILQSLNRGALSRRDLQAADKQIEALDFSHTAMDSLGRYLFSDDAGPYRAPMYEKLLINTINMLNYLQEHDLAGARVEARRLTVMQNYYKDQEGGDDWMGLGSYLAGFIFEKTGKASEALRYYDEALTAKAYSGIEAAIARVGAKSGYRTPRLREILQGRETPDSAEVAKSGQLGDVLMVVQYGRIASKVAKRIPIGLALTYAAGGISPDNHSKANALAAQGLVTWVNYPRLADAKRYRVPRFWVNDHITSLPLALSVDAQAHKTWEAVRGPLVSSAITRMISRVVAGQVAKKVSGGGAVGSLLSLATQVTLTANDVPDTRSWSTLPANIALARVQLPPGHHEFKVQTTHGLRRASVDLEPGGWSVLNLTSLR